MYIFISLFTEVYVSIFIKFHPFIQGPPQPVKPDAPKQPPGVEAISDTDSSSSDSDSDSGNCQKFYFVYCI